MDDAEPSSAVNGGRRLRGMSLPDALIKKRFQELGVTVTEAAAAAGISPTELASVLDHDASIAMGADRFFDIMAVWGMDVQLTTTPEWDALPRALTSVDNASELEIQPSSRRFSSCLLAKYAHRSR